MGLPCAVTAILLQSWNPAWFRWKLVWFGSSFVTVFSKSDVLWEVIGKAEKKKLSLHSKMMRSEFSRVFYDRFLKGESQWP